MFQHRFWVDSRQHRENLFLCEWPFDVGTTGFVHLRWCAVEAAALELHLPAPLLPTGSSRYSCIAVMCLVYVFAGSFCNVCSGGICCRVDCLCRALSVSLFWFCNHCMIILQIVSAPFASMYSFAKCSPTQSHGMALACGVWYVRESGECLVTLCVPFYCLYRMIISPSSSY
jgi:hypothetical protein